MSHPMPPSQPSPPAAPAASAPTPAAPPNHLPERIRLLADISQNLWWSWQLDARELFHRIDRRLWEGTRHNAVQFLRQVSVDRLAEHAQDPISLERYDRVVRRFELLTQKNGTWFAGRYPELLHRPIAYFSAEFALHRSLPIYSGGLGVLAGDHCKEASDLGRPSRRTRPGPDFPGALRSCGAAVRAAHAEKRHLVRRPLSRAAAPPDCLLLRGIRPAPLAPDLFRRPRRPGRRPLQGSLGPR